MSAPITKSQLSTLDKVLDRAFGKIGIDVEFTTHFLDRVNDARNGRQITVQELVALFAKEYKRWGKPIANLGPGSEAILNDLASDINIPFILKWDKQSQELDMVAKTVMRKKEFHSPDKKFTVEEIRSFWEATKNH